MSKAVVLFSGGQDSTTCLFWAKNRFESVHAISFNYGQKHSVELQQAAVICQAAGVSHLIVDVSFLASLSRSALVDHGADMNAKRPDGLPASFVPNRNQLFLTIAHAYAQQVEARAVIAGMCETDFSGYPDCRNDFVKSLMLVSNMGSGAEIEIKTPLMWLNKAETFKLAETEGHLRDVVRLSHTCYNGDREHLHDWGYGCATCPACELRQLGWEEYQRRKKDGTL